MMDINRNQYFMVGLVLLLLGLQLRLVDSYTLTPELTKSWPSGPVNRWPRSTPPPQYLRRPEDRWPRRPSNRPNGSAG